MATSRGGYLICEKPGQVHGLDCAHKSLEAALDMATSTGIPEVGDMMATSTGKKARKRYGNRYAAKRVGGRGDSTKRPRQRRTWGKLPYSVAAGNAPQAAVNANEALIARIYDERRRNGWDDDANVMVPGPTRASRPRIQEEHVD